MTEPAKRKWTGGEWRVHNVPNQVDEEGNPVIDILAPFGEHTQVVAAVYSESKLKREANAHLLAASPQLFEELEQTTAILDALLPRLENCTEVGIIESVQSHARRNRAALAAALGEGE